MRVNIIFSQVLIAVLTIAAIATGQSAWAQSNWEVENISGSQFKIKRTGDISKSESIYYVTLSRTAIAGVHFTNLCEKVTFGPGEDSRIVTVSEENIDGLSAPYRYQSSGNSLFYPETGASLGAFRAYFQLLKGLTASGPASQVKAFVMNLGDKEDDPTALNDVLNTERDSEWYDLSGRKLNGKPTRSGVYIHNGRKVRL